MSDLPKDKKNSESATSANNQDSMAAPKSKKHYKDREEVLEGLSEAYSSTVKTLELKLKGVTDPKEKAMLEQAIKQVNILQVQCQEMVKVEKDIKAEKLAQKSPENERSLERAVIGAILEIERQITEVVKQAKEVTSLGAKPEISIKIRGNKVEASVEGVAQDGSKKSLGELRNENMSKEKSPLAAGKPSTSCEPTSFRSCQPKDHSVSMTR